MSGPVEELEGVGKILQDEIEVGEVTYSIRVVEAGRKGWQYPYARFRQRGYLEFYELLNKPITLVLEDGRRWDCCINSLTGTVVAVGNWPTKKEG
jgi:hypothetical protein